MHCRYCGNDNLEYIGIDDGRGDYGDELADIYECCDCGMTIEVTQPHFDDESKTEFKDDTEYSVDS